MYRTIISWKRARWGKKHASMAKLNEMNCMNSSLSCDTVSLCFGLVKSVAESSDESSHKKIRHNKTFKTSGADVMGLTGRPPFKRQMQRIKHRSFE
jgi:hypothetical protein